MTTKICFIISFTFSIIIFSQSSFAQKPEFTYLQAKDGLSGNTQWSVNAVAKDKKGFVWFITMGGLNRWDGYAIKSYSKVSTDQKDLPNNQLSAIAIDKNDNIWLGTQEEGIVFFDTKKETFKAIDFTKISKNGISFSQINRLTVDDTNTLYILAGFQGLFKYEIDQNKFEAYAKLNARIGGSVSDVIFTKNGKIIVAASNGFFHLHSKDQFDFYEKPYEYFIRTMVELPDEQFYVFIQNVEKHYVLNLKEKTLKLLPNPLPHLAINGIVDQENNFWVSYMDGILTKHNLSSKNIEQYTLSTKLYNHEVAIGLLGMYNSLDQKTYSMTIGSGAGIMDRSKKMIRPFLSKEYTNLKIIDD
jgi:ligand-binding sensor domain-containing protein